MKVGQPFRVANRILILFQNIIQKGVRIYPSTVSVPYRTVPYRTVPYRTVPYRTVPYRTVPYPTVFRERPFWSTAQRTVLI
jgi:hypothetical protein